MHQITDKYDVDTLDKVLAFFSVKKTGDFIFPNHLKKILPGFDEAGIEALMVSISDFDSSILATLPRNNMYHHPFQKGPYLDKFLTDGGFKMFEQQLQIGRKKEADLTNLERENLAAAPEAVRVAAEANRLSNAANIIARQNKKITAVNTVIACLALILSILAFLKTYNII